MIDLKKAGLPEAVEVEGSLYNIQTSFKYWLRFLELLENKDVTPNDFDFMYRNSKPSNRQDGILALMQFCNPPEVLPRFRESEGDGKVVDYIIDADYIYSAFLEQYGVDLIISDMHWYKFQALFRGLHDTKLNEIIGYRLYKHTSGKKDSYVRHMEKLRSAWELPTNIDEDDEELKDFESKLRGTE
jgi:hypothetical protein